MPTTPVATYSAGRVDPLKNPDGANVEVIGLAAGTYLGGTLVGEVTATPGTYKAYASANADGSQLPTHILQYSCVVDGSGNVSLGTGTVGEWSQTQKGCPAYRSGLFSCADLTGLDANVITIKRATLVAGTVTAGRVMLLGN